MCDVVRITFAHMPDQERIYSSYSEHKHTCLVTSQKLSLS